MGHFHETYEGVGSNRMEAEQNAIAELLHELGHRHSVRGIDSAEFVGREPPMRLLSQGGNVFAMGPDCAAPKSEWAERWRFVIHTHA